MTDKVQKIREGVEKLKSQLLRGACSSQIAMETMCKEEAYNEILAILDTMQEEPVSKELEEAANNALNNVLNTHEIVNVRSCLEMFRFGANWKKEQMMTKAVDAELYSDGMLTPLIGIKDKEKISNIKFGDKVKLIIIKENKDE